MKLARLGVGLDEVGSSVDWVFAAAREDITPPIMAMPIVPGEVNGGADRVLVWRWRRRERERESLQV